MNIKVIEGIPLAFTSVATAVVIALSFVQDEAHAKPGLYAQARTKVNDTDVVRIVDTEHGVVCYLASRSMHGRNSGAASVTAAISCVKIER